MSKSCHVRPIRCLRPQIFMGWLEMWRNFILGMGPIQPFCWDLLHSMVSHHLSWLAVKGQLAKLAVKGQPCISIDTEFAFQALSCLWHISVSCLCLSQLLQSSHCFKRAKIYLCPQSCLWSDATKLLFFSSVLYNKRLYQMKISNWWKKYPFFCLSKM